MGGESLPFHRAASGNRRAREPLDYLVLIFLLGLFAAIGILGWQVYCYLRYGEWPALSMIALLQWLNIGWASSPRDWVGLRNLLDAIPLSMFALLSGVVPVGVWLWWDERAETKQPVEWGG